jgi:hypothetical protein
MVDDGQSRELERAPEAAQPELSTYNPLRLIIIVLILFVAVVLGLHFKSRASPGTEPSSFSSQPPQYINVYERYFSIPVALTVTLGQYPNLTTTTAAELRSEGYTDFFEEVDVTASPPQSASLGIIMISSNIAPLSAPLPGSPDKVIPIENPSKSQRFVVQVTLTPDLNGKLSGTVYFGPIPIIYANNGSVFGHLPSIGALEEGTSNSLYAYYANTTGQLREVTFGVLDPFIHKIPGDTGIFLARPLNLSYTETLGNIVPALRSQQIDYAVPPMTVNGIDYVWSGCCGSLEPAFKETDPDAVDSQNQAAFYSGIAFGVAGAAAIALVQEIPEHRKRKRSASHRT